MKIGLLTLICPVGMMFEVDGQLVHSVQVFDEGVELSFGVHVSEHRLFEWCGISQGFDIGVDELRRRVV